MNRRAAAALLGAVGLLVAGTGVAQADPVPGAPGTPPPGKTPAQIYATVGADAFAELTNFVATNYNATSPPAVIASYDAVNPDTGVAGENITTKPGCTVARPNGANAGLTAFLLNQTVTGDPTQYCIDFVRSSRSKKTDGTENGLTFYEQSRDAVGYATVGNAYAPVAPLTTAQLKDIFECTVTDWSDVGGQAGPIHVYLPPASAATLTFFLQALGTSLTNVQAGCGTSATNPNVHNQQQNDGRTLDGDPLGIAPYAITKWAAQKNGAPGIPDNRGGVSIGLVNTTTSPTTTATVGAVTYTVLNPSFATGASTSFGRIFFNAVRNDAPQGLKDIFKAGGYLCQHQQEFLVPFGNTPLGDDTTQSRYCGKPD